MKLKTKKIIAKEFLILMGCLLFSVILFLGTFIYNYVIEIKKRNTEKLIIPINDQIQSLEDLKNEKLSKQKWFFEKGIERITPGIYNSSEVWEKMEFLQKNDSIFYGWENDWSETFKNSLKYMGFKNAQELENFIKENSIVLKDSMRIDSINTEKLKLNNKITSFNENILSLEDQFNLFIIVFIIIAIVTFPIRFLFIFIIWSTMYMTKI